MILFILFLMIVVSIRVDSYQPNTSIIHIHEELPPNTLLLSTISLSSSIQWLPSSYSYQKYFHVKNNQSLYTTDQRLDREEFCQKNLCNCSSCSITLSFLQTFSSSNVSIRSIDVIIEDINDYSPTFKQSFVQLSIAENVPVGYEIPLESAIDHDFGIFSIQNYELHPMINNPFRLIKGTKPILKLNEPLDREKQTIYSLELIAVDGGLPPLSGQQRIEIIVTDVNDNPPIFDRSIYQRSIVENESVDRILVQIHATDRDEGDNGRISYSIDDPTSTFRINERTGEISLIKPLDYEKMRSYSIPITAHDHGTPQLNNYAQVIIDVTDVNDNVPEIMLTQINGTKHENQPINLPECTRQGTSLFYVYVTDEDSGDNGRISCTLNDTRLTLIYLTLNAYSLQISDSPSFDYETDTSMVIELKCVDFGSISLSKSILLHIQLEDCNDNPPDINSSILTNETVPLPYETLITPYIVTQLDVQDRDRFQLPIFTYSFTVTPSLDLSLTNNGTLILRSLPSHIGIYTIDIFVSDSGNLTSSLSLTIDIYSNNRTEFLKSFPLENTTMVLIISFFLIIFLASFLIGICFLIAFLLHKKSKSKQSFCSSCCYHPSKYARNSTCESTNSSNERADSSQKTTIEVLDDGKNSPNRIYQYGFKQANNSKVINTRTLQQADFNYSEKVERYLTHLNNGMMNADPTLSDEGVYGSSDISSDQLQQFNIRPPSVISIPTSQTHYHDSLKRFEQLYSLVEHRQSSAFASDSLYV